MNVSQAVKTLLATGRLARRTLDVDDGSAPWAEHA
jgi:hypothetical protein